MSEHKNYIERFEWSWEDFFDQNIIPYKDCIFELFSEKIKNDSLKDICNNKSKIGNRWIEASNLSTEIHNILSVNPTQELLSDLYKQKLKIVEDLIDMDYGTVSEVFNSISKRFCELKEIESSKKASMISELFAKMREKSKKHTNIINR